MTTDNTQTITQPVSFKVDSSLENKDSEQQQQQQQQIPPTEQEKPQTQSVFKTFQTQEDFDNETAKIRGVAERKAENEILKALGIDSKDKLEAIKQAYQNSLTEEDKKNEALKELDGLRNQIVEKDAIIVALTKLSGKETDEVTKLVKMAKGLVGDDYSMEQALDEVMKMAQVNVTPQKSSIPVSQQIPSGNTIPNSSIENNPFKDNNLTAIGKIIKENPDHARELAKAVNYPITW